MSAVKPPDPNRPLARLLDGPYAGAVLYTDALLANIRASSRYPLGHPAGDFARYVQEPVRDDATGRLVGPAVGGPAAAGHPDTEWSWKPLTATEEALRHPDPALGVGWGRGANLELSAGLAKAARDHAAALAEADPDGDES